MTSPAFVGNTGSEAHVRRAAAEPRRFVKLPTDGERAVIAAGTGDLATYEAATLPPRPRDARGPAQFLGVLCALLQRCTEQGTIAIDLIVRADSGPERHGALDATLAGDMPIASAIAQAAAALDVMRAVAASPVPTETIASSNVAVTFIDAPQGSRGSFDARSYAAATPACELHLIVPPGDAPVVVAYDAKLFHASTIERLVDALGVLLAAAACDESVAIEQLPILGPTELRALTTDRNSGTIIYPRKPVHRLFEALASARPSAVAATFHGQAITYGELDARSNRLAHHLVASGVGPEIAVGVCVRPSLDVLVAVLAIWKARGVYLPLDPTHPEALLARMLDEAQPRVVLTHAALSSLTLPDRFSQLCMDTDWARVEAHPDTPPDQEPTLEDAAYLLYTSGTTGKPKGVVATQSNLAHYVHSAQQMYGFRADDVFASLARYTFSISLFDLLSPLCCGGSLRILDRDEVLSPDRLARALGEVTVVHAGPSLLGGLFRYLRATSPSPAVTFPRMRHASTGGDLVPPSIMEEMKRVFANAEIYVIYGCTEISCMGTTFPVRRDREVTRSFVGMSFPDVTVRVLDPKRALVPFGVVGEICFAGKGVVRGYLHQPALTAEKFVTLDGERFYQTGDVGRLHADGNLEILGRRDYQVQLRGIRVELAGIENTVRELGLADQCAVVAKRLDVDDVRLVAFVVKPKDSSLEAFRRALSVLLPDYMLPQSLVVLEAMPLTANGKLDRARLQEMKWESSRASTPHARALPQTALEKTIAEVLCGVLGVDEIGVDESFFDLGGHSLLAVVAIQKIEVALGAAFSPYALFECATVRGLAAHAEGARPSPSRPILLNERTTAPPLFMLSGVHIYRELARRLEGRVPAFGVFAGKELRKLDTSTTTYTVEELAAEYVTMIRREQPSGPYRLLGYSFAGIVAYEAAQQLRADGEEVRFLALVDAVLPEWTLGWRYRVSQLARVPTVPLGDLVAFARGRLRKSIGAPGSEFVRYGGDPRLGPLEEQRDQVNYRAAAEYMTTMRPFDGNVTLIASGDRLRHDPLKSPTGGWGPHVPSLECATIGADHFRLLSDDPYVSQLAEILVKRLRALG